MAEKENKGGWLRPEQVEEDLKVKDKTDSKQSYSGSQDTGDEELRQMGNEIQRRDGQPEGESNEDS